METKLQLALNFVAVGPLHFGTPEGFEASANPNAPSGAERLLPVLGVL